MGLSRDRFKSWLAAMFDQRKIDVRDLEMIKAVCEEVAAERTVELRVVREAPAA